MTTLIATLLFGCASHDGTYSPGCIAYEGSKISLSDGQFVWEKFTDSVDDLFVFYLGDGADWIGDFTAGALTDDAIALYGFGPLDFGGLSLTDDAGDTLIDLGGSDQITLAGVSSTDLAADDFQFFA